MRKLLSLAILTSCFCVSAYAGTFQQGTMAAEGRMGFSVPLGDFSDDYDSSFNLGGSFLYGLSNVVVLEGNLNYNTSFNCQYGSACDLDILEFTGGARYLFPTNNLVIPYLGGGAGLYHSADDNDSRNDFGINYGGGVLINVHPKVALDLGAKFNTVFADSTENYLSLTGGIIYFFSL